MERKPVRRALVSVFDKRGLVELASALADQGAELVATSSSAAALRDLGLQVTDVSEMTGFPEILGGRVKTLHPKVHAGILARQELDSDLSDLAELNIEPFDAVIGNLYPFKNTLRQGATVDEAVEMIDIGGPTMIRAAAKNYASVAVVTSPLQYSKFVEMLRSGGTTLGQRAAFAVDAFRLIANYDIDVANWITEINQGSEDLPKWFALSAGEDLALRYGENPHQGASLYRYEAGPNAPRAIEENTADENTAGIGLAGAKQLWGKPLSYNNFQDTDAALKAVADFTDPAVAIIKHANPCGLAAAATPKQAYVRALQCDPLSAFGGVVAVNRQVDEATAEQISNVFTEVIAAPSFTPESLEILQKKPSLRILEVDPADATFEFKQISGGLIAQEPDSILEAESPDNWQLVAGLEVSAKTLADLDFAWRAVKSVKSNAILLAKDRATVGVGMGQVNRMDSAKLAVERANTLAGDEERARGAVAASDAFFPFADGLEVLADAGVTAVVSPGGSKRDQEVIDAAQAAGVSLFFTGHRHFWH